MDTLQRLDTELFTFLNQSVHSPVLDKVMQFLSSALLWWGVFGLVAVYVLVRRNWKSVRVILAILIAIVLADTLSFRVLKPMFARYRPCYQQSSRILMLSCGSPYGMPSNHAANAMAVATVVSLANPLAAPLAVFLAFLVGLSRIYVGVHYPSDIAAGFLVGMVVGTSVYSLFGWYERRRKVKVANRQ